MSMKNFGSKTAKIIRNGECGRKVTKTFIGRPLKKNGEFFVE